MNVSISNPKGLSKAPASGFFGNSSRGKGTISFNERMNAFPREILGTLLTELTYLSALLTI
jgi:hypothetical protein